MTTVEEVTNYTKAGGGCGSCRMRIEEIIDEVWVDLEKCGVPRPGYVPTPIPSITISTASAAAAAVEKTRTSPIYNDCEKILKEISQGLEEDGSKVELDTISGTDVVVKLEGPASKGMMRDMTLDFIAKKLSDGTGRAIKVLTR